MLVALMRWVPPFIPPCLPACLPASFTCTFSTLCDAMQLALGVARSSLFLSLFVGLAFGGACASNQVAGRSTGAIMASGVWMGGIATLVEKKSRRMELAMYVMAR